MTTDVIDIFHASLQNYGTRKIQVELKNPGFLLRKNRDDIDSESKIENVILTKISSESEVSILVRKSLYLFYNINVN